MSTLKIERIGGLGGFGGANSHLKSIGEIDMDQLSEGDKKSVEDLFTSSGKAEGNQIADGFRYRISRTTPEGTESIEAGEENVPGAITQSVRDEIV